MLRLVEKFRKNWEKGVKYSLDVEEVLTSKEGGILKAWRANKMAVNLIAAKNCTIGYVEPCPIELKSIEMRRRVVKLRTERKREGLNV